MRRLRLLRSQCIYVRISGRLLRMRLTRRPQTRVWEEQIIMATSVEEQTLSDRDVAEIVQDIFDVQNETEALGRVLKLPKATVESIHRQQHSRPKDRLFHIIDEFVKQVEPRPTWKVIANALRSPLIGQPRLALDIERKHCTNTEANAIRSLQAEDIEVAVAQYLLKEKVEQLQSENDALKQQLARKEIELMRAEETVRKEQQAIQEMRQRETELVQAKDREIAKIQGLMKHMEQQIQKMEQIETVSVDAKDKELSETQKEPSQEGDNECGFLVTESLQQSGTEAETENQSETAMCQSLNLGVKLTEDAEPPLTQENEWFTRDQEHLQPKEQETESGSSEPAKSQEKENTIKTLVAENLQEIEPTMEEAEQSSFYTCKVSGPGLTSATVNEPTHILVELTDSHGRPLPLQHNVTVKLELVPNAKYPTPETTLTRWSKKPPEMSVSVDMISTFQYKVLYTTVTRGQYSLHIYINDQDTRGSPFHITAFFHPNQIGPPVKKITDLKAPYCISSFSNREIVVTESKNHTLSVFDKNGGKIRTFGSHGEGPEEMIAPRGVAIDDTDKIYVSSEHKLQKFTRGGQLIKFVGQKGSKEGEFDRPRGIALYGKQVYVCDKNNHRIQVFDLDLNFVQSIGSRGRGRGEFNQPQDVAFDANGKMYVADCFNKRVQVVDATGQFIQEFGREGERKLSGPSGLHVVDKYVYVSDYTADSVLVYDTEGKFVAVLGKRGWFGSRPSSEVDFYHPYGITSCADGFIYVCDRWNNRVQIF